MTETKTKLRAKFIDVIKSKSKEGNLYCNILHNALIETVTSDHPKPKPNQWKVKERKEMIAKYSRIARFGNYCEDFILQTIKQYVPCLDVFIKEFLVAPTCIVLDEKGKATDKMADTPDLITKHSVSWITSWMEKIPGTPMSLMIADKKIGFFEIMDLLENQLSILFGLQKFLNYTHEDYHGRNNILVPCKSKHDFNLYLWESEVSFLCNQGPYDLKIIDHEYCYTIANEDFGLKGMKFDSIHLNRTPFRFNPEKDAISIVKDSLYHYLSANLLDHKEDEEWNNAKSCSDFFDSVLLFLNKQFEKKGNYKEIDDKIFKEIMYFLDNSLEFEYSKKIMKPFLQTHFYVLLEFVFYDIKWNSQLTKYISAHPPSQHVAEDQAMMLQTVSTLDSDEIAEWKKNFSKSKKERFVQPQYTEENSESLNSSEKINIRKKKNTDLITRIYDHLSTDRIESELKKNEARIRDKNNIQFSPFLDDADSTKKPNYPFQNVTEDIYIIKYRIVFYRLFCKITSHVLSIIKDGKDNFEFVFLILRKLIEKRKEGNTNFNDLDIIAERYNFSKKDWARWFHQFLFYKENCAENIFELYRIYDSYKRETFPNFNAINNLNEFRKLNIKFSEEKLKNRPICLDPLVVLEILNSTGFTSAKRMKEITENSIFKIYRADFNEPVYFHCSELSEDEITFLKTASKESIITLISSKLL